MQISLLTKYSYTMQRNIKQLAVLFVAAVAMLTAACSKEENKDNQTNNNGRSEESFEMTSLDLTYSITVDSRAITAMTEGYTPTLQYYDANDQSVTVTPFPFNASNLTWAINIKQTSFPSHFGFKLSLTPKEGIAEDVKYDCDITPTITAIATGKDGKRINISPSIQQFRWSGIKPSNGRVMKIERLYKIQKSGDYEQVTFDYPN